MNELAVPEMITIESRIMVATPLPTKGAVSFRLLIVSHPSNNSSSGKRVELLSVRSILLMNEVSAETSFFKISWRKGTVLCSGPPAEVKEHPEVRRRYLGDIDAGMPGQSITSPAASVPHSGPPAPHIASGGSGSEELTRERRKPFANW